MTVCALARTTSNRRERARRIANSFDNRTLSVTAGSHGSSVGERRSSRHHLLVPPRQTLITGNKLGNRDCHNPGTRVESHQRGVVGSRARSLALALALALVLALARGRLDRDISLH